MTGSKAFPLIEASGATDSGPHRNMQARIAARHEQGGKRLQQAIFWVAVIAVSFNGILAIVNAHIFRIGFFLVSLAEVGLIAACAAIALLTWNFKRDVIPLATIYVFAILALIVSLINGLIFPDLLRNFIHICLFTMVGARATEKTIDRIFLVLVSVILAVLIMEIFWPSAYVQLFQPAVYMESSRGLTQFELNDTGLFANALGFEGRFSYNLFSVPRTSSIFVEQVGLANFAAVLSIYLLTAWPRIPNSSRLLVLATIFFILTSNNTRISSGVAVVLLIGYKLFPVINGRLRYIMPIVILTFAFTMVYMFTEPGYINDDLLGRMAVTVYGLGELSVSQILGGAPYLARRSFDSGYVYLVQAGTAFGLIAAMSYVVIAASTHTAEQRRGAWGVTVYAYVLLMFGGTSFFSVKTSAILWLLIGSLRFKHLKEVSLNTTSQSITSDSIENRNDV